MFGIDDGTLFSGTLLSTRNTINNLSDDLGDEVC